MKKLFLILFSLVMTGNNIHAVVEGFERQSIDITSKEYEKSTKALEENINKYQDELQNELKKQELEKEQESKINEAEEKLAEARSSLDSIKSAKESYDTAIKENNAAEQEAAKEAAKKALDDYNTTMEEARKLTEDVTAGLKTAKDTGEQEPVQEEPVTVENWYEKGFIGKIINKLKSIFFPGEKSPLEKARNDFEAAQKALDDALNNPVVKQLNNAFVNKYGLDENAPDIQKQLEGIPEYKQNIMNRLKKQFGIDIEGLRKDIDDARTKLDQEQSNNLKTLKDDIAAAEASRDQILLEEVPKDDALLNSLELKLEELNAKLEEMGKFTPEELANKIYQETLNRKFEELYDKKNAYEILGISTEANSSEISSAYRKKAIYYHPDKLQGLPEEEKAKREQEGKALSNAFNLLKDPSEKTTLDYQINEAKKEIQSPAKLAASLTKNTKNQISELSEDIETFRRESKKMVDAAIQRVKDAQAKYEAAKATA